MSWKVQALVSERVCGGMSRKMILINMAARANDDGTGVYASLPTMAAWCEVDARTIRRVIRSIEQDGLASIVGQRECKNGYVNEWALNLDAIMALPLVKDELQERRKNKVVHKQTPDIMSARTLSPPGHNATPDIKSGRTQSPATPDIMSAKSIQEPISPSSLPSEAQKPPKGGDSDRGSRLPANWTLDAELIGYAVEHGYSEHEAEFINHRFENHWRAATGRAARKKDWRRTFQNWVTNEKRWQVRDGAAAWRKAASASGEDWIGFIALWRADPKSWPSRLGPPPGSPGYRGPALDPQPDLLSQGGKR